MIKVGDKVKFNISNPSVCAYGLTVNEAEWKAKRESIQGKIGYVVQVAPSVEHWPYNVMVDGETIHSLYRNELIKQ